MTAPRISTSTPPFRYGEKVLASALRPRTSEKLSSGVAEIPRIDAPGLKTWDGRDYGDFSGASQEEMETDARMLAHPSRERRHVMGDLLQTYPEQSFCFVDIARLRRRIALLREAFLPGDPRAVIAYAVKANPRRELLRYMSDCGVRHFDCASRGEIDTVLSISPQATPFFNHPVQRALHLRAAAKRGVRHFTVQSLRGLRRVLENTAPFIAQENLEIAVRFEISNRHAVIDLSSTGKFGAEFQKGVEILRCIASETAASPGVYIHTGSQNRDPQSFARGVERIAEAIRQAGCRVQTVNLGGGLPAAYGDEEYDLRSFLAAVNDALESRLDELMIDSPDAKVIIEPGRGIIAEAVDMTIPVLEREERRGQTCLYVGDSLFQSFGDRVVHGWRHHFQVMTAHAEPRCGPIRPFRVFGQSCDSGDDFQYLDLPETTTESDHLLVENSGAYLDCLGGGFQSGASASAPLSFNGFIGPKYVAYNID